LSVSIPTQLLGLISEQSTRPIPPGVRSLCEEIRARYGIAVQAILFYGSCLRRNDESEGIVDLYVLLDRYRSGYRNLALALANKALPPNVFYLELPSGGGLVRAKYAVLSLRDFERGTSRHWFHSYLWGRFAQPAVLAYALNDRVADDVRHALAQAVLTFMSRVLPRISEPFVARDLWQQGLTLSYRAELRSERVDKLTHLYEAWQDYYEGATRAALGAVPFPVEVLPGTMPPRYRAAIPASARSLSRLAWAIRSVQGKVLSVLRLAKGLFTFQGGPEYIAWKIERHSGIRVELTARQRRYPLLALWQVVWRLYRSGAFR
jgi:predicted nucleotidyltransferase